MTRPCRIAIDSNALIHNVSLARECAPRSQIVAVVKANAYGHGAVDVARTLEVHADVLAVSCLEEALSLRKAGLAAPLLMLEGCFSDAELHVCSQQEIQIVCHKQQQIEMLQRADLAAPVKVWLKIDTGMHRLGIQPEHAAHAMYQLRQLKSVDSTVLTSHLANADDMGSDYTPLQLDRFDRARKEVEERLGKGVETSIPNSAGLMAWPQSHGTYHRPGIMLYGLSPFASPHPVADKLQAVMTFEADIIALRTVNKGDVIGYGNHWQAQRLSLIATVAAGYGDGYPRTAQNGTPAWLRGQRVPLAGRVSMDMLMLDVTEVVDVAIGDTVELWGKNLSANEIAAHAGTIGYELVTRMTGRGTRVWS